MSENSTNSTTSTIETKMKLAPQTRPKLGPQSRLSKPQPKLVPQSNSQSKLTSTNQSKSQSALSRATQPTDSKTRSDEEVDEESEVETDTKDVLSPDSSNFDIMHPLMNEWVMWYDTPQSKQQSKGWDDVVKKILDFSTVEAFWCLFNNLVAPSNLQLKSHYYLFKKGIKPAWEDPGNEGGGTWQVELPRADFELLNQAWLYTILGMIGESFSDNDAICGAVVSVRKGRHRMGLWTKYADRESLQMQIGRDFRKIMELPRSMPIVYLAHSDSLNSSYNYKSTHRYEIK